jgi:prolyl-tRNA editing enzyme YbaK/EbsC (Cys-tRNA(Pro) deacylase)
MTVTEQTQEALEARGTAGSSLVKTTALALAILCAQYNASVVPTVDRVSLSQTQSSTGVATSLETIDERDIFMQFHRVYDELLYNQTDLDTDAKRALYENLWDLYT